MYKVIKRLTQLTPILIMSQQNINTSKIIQNQEYIWINNNQH